MNRAILVFFLIVLGPQAFADTETQILTHPDYTYYYDRIGEASAVDGHTIAVSARENTYSKVLIYDRDSQGTWINTAEIVVGTGLNALSRINALALSGDRLFVGRHDGVFVFDRDAGGPNNWGRLSQNGYSGGVYQLDFSNGRLAIGKFGSVEIVDVSGSTLTTVQTLTNGEQSFGSSLALDGDRLVVGGDSVIVYELSGGMFVQDSVLVQSNWTSVAASGTGILVGVVNSSAYMVIKNSISTTVDQLPAPPNVSNFAIEVAFGGRRQLVRGASKAYAFHFTSYEGVLESSTVQQIFGQLRSTVDVTVVGDHVFEWNDDSDTILNSQDNCPRHANQSQIDTDGDGQGDACDRCPNDSTNDDPDYDDICGALDNCPNSYNPDQLDLDGDGIGDVCDICPDSPDNLDSDQDSVCDVDDNCPMVMNSSQLDTDGDGVGNACDICVDETANLDSDNDTVCDGADNCPYDSNVGQQDYDSDGLGDVCDMCATDPDNDIDQDGVCGVVDNCRNTPNPDQSNQDGDSRGDVCDVCPLDSDNDSDRDGVCGDVDNCPSVSNSDQLDRDNDGVGDLCDQCKGDPDNDIDGDGMCGDYDNCPTVPNELQLDDDLDGVGNACETNDAESTGCRGDSGVTFCLWFLIAAMMCFGSVVRARR